jgi:ArsR family transcriptional regulator, arsenate/arsenite/antimonite-responsive transcriptional repressor
MVEKPLLDNATADKQAELFAALADPTRLKLLQILCRQNPPGCRCVNNLSQLLGITQSAVSQHLRILRSAGLVNGERRGFRIHYLIDQEGLKRCQALLTTALEVTENCNETSCQQNCHAFKLLE